MSTLRQALLTPERSSATVNSMEFLDNFEVKMMRSRIASISDSGLVSFAAAFLCGKARDWMKGRFPDLKYMLEDMDSRIPELTSEASATIEAIIRDELERRGL